MRFKPLEMPRKWGHVRLTIHAWLVVTLVFGSAVNPALAATYFVSTTGSDGADGSSGTPWRTITRAINDPNLVSGDTVNVAAGTYDSSEPNEVFPLFLVDGVAILGADRDTTFVRPPDGTQAFRNDNTDLSDPATRLSGFTLQEDPNDTDSDQALVQFDVGDVTMSPQIDDNHFVGDPTEDDTGILYRDSDSSEGHFTATIDGNTFTGFQEAGIFDSQDSGSTDDEFSPTISNNSFTANEVGILFSLTGTTPSAAGGRGGGSAEGDVAPIIEDNAFGDASGGGNANDIRAHVSPQGEDLSFAPTIRNNTFTGTSNDSISISASFVSMSSTFDTFELSPTIEDNTFGDPNDPNDPNDLGPGDDAISVFVDEFNTGNFVSDMTIRNNTITGSGEDAISISVDSLSDGDACNVDWTVSNNSITNAGEDGIAVFVQELCGSTDRSGGTLPAASRGSVANNFSLTVAGNTITGTGDNGITVTISSFSSVPVTVLIDNNTITDVGLGCGSTTTTTTTTSPVAEGKGKSRARGGCSFQDGIYLSISDLNNATVSATVTNNTVTRTADDGIEVSVATVDSENVTVHVDDNIVVDAGILSCLPPPPFSGEGDRGVLNADGITFDAEGSGGKVSGTRGNNAFGNYVATISGNTITGPADDGISISISFMDTQNLSFSVSNNTITDAGSCDFGTGSLDRGRGAGGRGIALEMSDMSTVNATLTLAGNTISGSRGDGMEISISNFLSFTSTQVASLDQTVLVQGNTVTGGDSDGIDLRATDQSGVIANDIQITENLIQSNVQDGLRVLGNRYVNGNPMLVSCNTITSNGGNGILQDYSSTSTTTSPQRGNGAFFNDPADFGGGNRNSPGLNVILGNATNGPDPNDPNDPGPFQFFSRHPDPISAENNFWDSNDPVAIDAGIYDDDEDPNTGAVDFDPFRTSGTLTASVPLVDGVVIDVDPPGATIGDTIEYTAVIDVDAVLCNCPSIVFSAPIPANATLVTGSVITTQGQIVTEDPVNVIVGAVQSGQLVVIQWRVIPTSGTSMSTQGTLSCGLGPGTPSDDPDTPGIPDDPTITGFVPPSPTPTATATATPTATPTATATATATPGPLCSRGDSCFLWEMLDADFSVVNLATFTWRLTNNCTPDLTRADFRFVPGASVVAPGEGGTFTSRSGRTYSVDIVSGNNAGVGFTSTGTPLGTGQSDEFSFSVSRTTLQDTAVLWNLATAGASTGRIDMRSGLCYQVPASASVVEPEACVGASGPAQQEWNVRVRWSVPAQSGVRNFQLYRIEGAGEARSVHEGTLEPDSSGQVRFTDRCPAGAASGYRIQPVTRGGEPAEPATEVGVSACAPVLGSGTEMPQLLLFLALLACASLGLPRFRRRLRVR